MQIKRPHTRIRDFINDALETLNHRASIKRHSLAQARKIVDTYNVLVFHEFNKKKVFLIDDLSNLSSLRLSNSIPVPRNNMFCLQTLGFHLNAIDIQIELFRV